jgi:hypothetical protein
MARKFVGPTGSRRRRWLFLCTTFAAIATAVLVIPSAFAVHDTGLFQLDGDAFQATVPSGHLGGNDDWDSICNEHLGSGAATPGPLCYKAPGATLDASASDDKSTFLTDAFNAGSDNIFKGGTDDADISGWQWKQAAMSPNKADLEQAFAAQYTGTSAPYTGHKLLFFGGTRFANNGDTNIGLWFFHNPVSTSGANTNADGSCTKASGCGFSGVHQAGNVSLGGSTGAGCNPNPDPVNNICTPGDIFILSAFTQGGAEPTIKVFEWVGPGKATKNYLGSNNCFTNACTLQPLAIPNTPGFSDNRCDGAPVSADVACAIVNAQGAINSPWLFQDQASGAPPNVIGTNELYEGGLDLTGLGFGEACFSSVLVNTRSSQSGTSVLQDFALGGFGSCSTTTTTTPKDGSGNDIPAGGLSIGTGSVSAKDSATLTVNGVSTWSGTYTFHLCFIGTDTTSTATCTSGGTLINGSWSGAPNVDQSTATPLVSASATVTSAGRYCWRGNFDPSPASAAAGVPAAKDDTGGECFNVNPVTPGLTTQAVKADGTAQGTDKVSFGNAVYDTGTLTGTANKPGSPVINPTTAGAAAGGTITFQLYGPGIANCNTLAAGFATANPNGIQVTVSGDGTYPSGTPSSVTFVPQAPGDYFWKAAYSGDSPNTNPFPASGQYNSDCSVTDEKVTVEQIPTNINTKQSWFPNDTAQISAATGNLGNSGTVDFFLFDNNTCTGTALYSEEVTLGSNLGTSTEASTSNYTGSSGVKPGGGAVSPFRVTTAYADPAGSTKGPYYWKVVYTPAAADTSHTGKQSNCSESHTYTYTNDNSGGSSLP